jgi:NADPH-dependent ferric siderophore reductase
MSPLPVRFVRVAAVRPLTTHLRRVTFTGADLAPTEPDQQVKLYFPKPGRPIRLPPSELDMPSWYAAFTAIPEPERPWMRSYTLRACRPGEIDVDFVLHDRPGPATRWALSALPGDTLGMFGPSDLFARPVPLTASIAVADWVLLAGDATAVPAIATILESLPAGKRAIAYLDAEEQRFAARGDVTVHWLDGGLVEAVRQAAFPPGAVFAWLAGEAGQVRALRRHLVEERGVPKPEIDFAGYWRRMLSQDDAPTEEDLAEARERLSS